MFTWIAPEVDYTLDCARAEEMHASPVGQEEYPAGQVVRTQFKNKAECVEHIRGVVVTLAVVLMP